MENQNLQSASGANTSDTETDYISAINEIKANSVDKAKYEKLRDENKKLLNSLVKGETIETQKPQADIDGLRKKLFSRDSELSNLEYISTALELRKTLIERGEKDPFVPYGEKYTPTSDDIEEAQETAEALQECVDAADGNNDMFIAEINTRLNSRR